MTRLTLSDDGAALTVHLAPAPAPGAATAAATELVRYVYRPTDIQLESPKPYFHPIRTAGGDLVSLFRPHDHVWHKGIAWSLPHVGPHNFWGGPTFVEGEGYVQLDNDGSMVHEGFTAARVDDDGVFVTQSLAWFTQAGERVVKEVRSFSVTLATATVPSTDPGTITTPAAWVLTFSSTMTNVSGGDLPIGSPTTNGRENAGYGGLFWRGPRSFTGGTILAPYFAGGEEIRGQRAPWMGFTGTHDESARQSTLVMVDDAANPRGPASPGLDPEWFARNEWFACVCATPFFSEEIPFARQDSLTFRYAVVVADGGADAARGADLAEVGRGALEQGAANQTTPTQGAPA
ncbi:Methane oxygenase PmoA [Sanguibacter gelidistatuariae]|uniref:Methane oxygenase PmoA n=1 Tax=Sanguibacter gelidistatuariae TaxID=1814289 RepID=A0A1G6UQM4_9MICO|nr:PmoA family protein [Sanguibacter gelidistatuariae]SDD42847.1 Methane oxygenase PmoA [Sanguibacter gelidistatuariae]